MFEFIDDTDLHDEVGLLNNILDNVTPICGLKEPGPDHFSLDLLNHDSEDLLQHLISDVSSSPMPLSSPMPPTPGLVTPPPQSPSKRLYKKRYFIEEGCKKHVLRRKI